jgi:hypothetical protein
MPSAEPPPLRLMVSSTVYGQESFLDQVYGILKGYGYDVLMSHKGTIPVKPHQKPLDACLEAVDNCDLFLGIITGRYGSATITGEDVSITHSEVRRALSLNRPAWFLVRDEVVIASQLFRKIHKHPEIGPLLPELIRKNPIIDDIRLLDLYDEARQVEGNQSLGWVQQYHQPENAFDFLRTQFEGIARMQEDLAKDLTDLTEDVTKI